MVTTLLDDADIRSTRDPEELMRSIVRRGEVLARRRDRRHLAQRLVPAVLAVLLLGTTLALRLGSAGTQRDVETVPRPEPAVVQEPTPGPDELIPVPGTTLGVTSPTTPAPTTSGPGAHARPTPTTTEAAAPPPAVTVALDQPDGNLYRSVVLRPGAQAVTVLTQPTFLATDPVPAIATQNPVLSPDGGTVIYHGGKENVVGLGGVRTVFDLYSVPSTGGPSRRLTDLGLQSGGGAQWPDWSPDATRVVSTCPPAKQTESALCTVRPDGTDLTRLLETTHHLYFPRISPDGRWIATYEDVTPGVLQLWIVPMDGSSEPRQVPLSTYPRTQDGPSWSADGTHLLIGAQATPADPGHLQAIDVTTGRITKYPELPEGSNFVPCGNDRIALITTQAFGSAVAGDLVAVDLNGGRPQVLLHDATGQGLIPSSCRTVG